MTDSEIINTVTDLNYAIEDNPDQYNRFYFSAHFTLYYAQIYLNENILIWDEQDDEREDKNQPLKEFISEKLDKVVRSLMFCQQSIRTHVRKTKKVVRDQT